MPGAVILSQGTQPSGAGTCIPSGHTAGITAALSGRGAVAVLCPGATFHLTAPIGFTAPDQQIYTMGLPAGSTRATLVVESRSTGKLASMAIDGMGESGITVKNIQINGNRPALGKVPGGKALIEIGGNATRQTVQRVNAYETRGWSTLHVREGTVTNRVPACRDAKILDNTISDAGTDTATLTRADGISLACASSEVKGNTVTNATDGGIVIFGAPGSTIADNTVTAVSQNELGGINLVDYAPLDGNYTGTTVTGNIVDGKSAFMKVGIAMGPQVWGCRTPGTDYGATVTGNTVEGENVGYGYAVNGVRDWKVTGNTDTARHVGVAFAGCGGATSRPGAFQVASATSSTLQRQFAGGQHLKYVLGVSEPSVLRVPRPATACGVLTANQGLYPRQVLRSCDGRSTLSMQSDGNLVLRKGATALWSSATAGRPSAEVLMQADGNVVIYSTTGTPLWFTRTSHHPGARLVVRNDGNLVVYDPRPSSKPLWIGGR